MHKILREEKEIAAEQVSALQMQVETLGQVLQKLEEKEHIQQANISSLDKELKLVLLQTNIPIFIKRL